MSLMEKVSSKQSQTFFQTLWSFPQTHHPRHTELTHAEIREAVVLEAQRRQGGEERWGMVNESLEWILYVFQDQTG